MDQYIKLKYDKAYSVSTYISDYTTKRIKDINVILKKKIKSKYNSVYVGFYTDPHISVRMKKVIIKFFGVKSWQDSTEFEILDTLHSRSVRTDLFPKPYISLDFKNNANFIIANNKIKKLEKIQDVHRINIYEYIKGTRIFHSHIPAKKYMEMKYKHDEIFDQINELHRLNIIYGDIHLRNIILTPNNQLRLIDYDRCYVTENEDIKSKELDELNNIIRQISYCD